MYGAWHEWLSTVVSLLLSGAAIKMVDDFLDADYDICHGQRTLAARLGKAALPYIALMVVLAAWANLHVAVTLFLASHAVGMLSGWRDRRPFIPRGLVESLVSVALSMVLSGIWFTIWALAILAMADWLDDLIDVAADKVSGQRNMVLHLGITQTSLITLAAFALAVVVNAFDTVMVLIVIPVISLLAELSTRHLWKTTDESDEWHSGGSGPSGFRS